MKRFALLSAAVLLLAGCGGSSSSSLLGLGGSCSPHTYTLSFPSSGGYSASGQLTSATQCFSSATVTTSASALGPVLGSPFISSDPSAQVLLYLGVTFSATEYANGLPALTVTLPGGIATANRKFYVAENASGGTLFGWSATAEGPVTASGSTVSVPSGNGNTTFDANQEIELALYSVSAP